MSLIKYVGPYRPGVVVRDTTGDVYCPYNSSVTVSEDLEAALMAQQPDLWDDGGDGTPDYEPDPLHTYERVLAREDDLLVRDDVARTPVTAESGSVAYTFPAFVADADETLDLLSKPASRVPLTLAEDTVMSFENPVVGGTADLWICQPAAGGFSFALDSGSVIVPIDDLDTDPDQETHIRVHFFSANFFRVDFVGTGPGPNVTIQAPPAIVTVSTPVPTLSAPFDPLSLSPACWYKPETLSALADGAAVSSWTDSSGNARHAVQATGGNQPICKEAIVNGKDVVRFDGVDDFLRASFTLVQPEHIFIVCRWRATSATTDHIIDAAATVFGGTLWQDSGTTVKAYSGTATLTVAASGSDSWRQYAILFNGAGSETRVDGGTAVTGNLGALNMGGLTIGSGGGSGVAQSAEADVAEILIFPTALSNDDRIAVEGYLRGRYATA